MLSGHESRTVASTYTGEELKAGLGLPTEQKNINRSVLQLFFCLSAVTNSA